MSNLDVAKEHVAALQARDWERMGRTMADDVRREGPEGAETDAIAGKKDYLRWSADLLDPLYGFTWTPTRIQATEDGKSVWVTAQSEYEPSKGDGKFGYRLTVVFDFNSDGLIQDISYYWKTPRKRLAWDTVSRTKN
jgi:ketosteroid isomerase-like protein